MRRTKEESRNWDNRIRKMFKEIPDSDTVANRYRAIRHLLKTARKLPITPEGEYSLEYIKDVVYLDRKLRLWTEGKETVLKKELSDEFIIDNLL